MKSYDWPSEPIELCLERIVFPSTVKLQTKDYRSTGKYPIVDQGQNLIAGWTDNPDGLISSYLPIIVFGDHTRTFKYLDFPFVRGADGTQLLRPRAGIDALFFFYACQSIDLPSRGYNRHFTVLKEKSINLPPECEQVSIGLLLRRVADAISIQDRQLVVTEALKRAAMCELFSRGLRGDAQKETEIGLVPESWDVKPLNGYIYKPDYGYTASASSDAVGPRFLRITDIQDGGVDWDNVPYCACDQNSIASKRLNKNDVVVARIGATTGKAFLIKECPEAIFASYLIRIRADQNKLLPTFLYYYMQTNAYWQHIDQHKGGRLKGGVNIPILSSLPIPLAGKDEQREIVAILDAIERKIDLHKRKRAVLEELFKTLLHKLMTGEIRVGELDLSALTPAEKAEAAA